MFNLTPGRDTMPAHFWYQLNGKSAEENWIEQMNRIRSGNFRDPFFDKIYAAYDERKKAEEEVKDEDETYELKLKSEIRIKK